MRVSPGPGPLTPADALPARWSAPERMNVYVRVLGVPGGTSGDARPNREFEDLWLRFVISVAQPAAGERFRAAAADLAAQAGPLIAAAARDVWQVVDQVGDLALGGAMNPSRNRTLAEAGGAILEWIAEHGASARDVDAGLLHAVEQWLAVHGAHDGEAPSQPDAAQRVAAWSQALHHAAGLDARDPPHGAALFSGPAGTGKTLAAHWLATSLDRDVHRIDLSQVTGKYIGDTERNLDAVFADAERAGAVLVFDEADALFGRRSDVKDSHDRYANLETAALLERIERYDGLTIVTSNRADEIDPAVLERFVRRVEFPF